MRWGTAISLVCSAAVVAGCGGGGGGDAQGVLSKTAANLGTIHSGSITFDLDVAPIGGAHKPFGFRVVGPFALARRGALPETDVRYTQRASGKRETVELVSTGREAFIGVRGKTYRLPADRAAPLRSATAELGGSGGGIKAFPLDKWMKSAKLSDGGSVGGAATDHVHAALDVVQAMNDLGIAAHEGALTKSDVERLRHAAKDAKIDVWTGKKDRLLRRLVLSFRLGLGVPAAFRSALGSAVGARIRVELAISRPNRAVHVQAPANALPYSALGR